MRRMFAQQYEWGARRSGRGVDERLVSVLLVDPVVVFNAALWCARVQMRLRCPLTTQARC